MREHILPFLTAYGYWFIAAVVLLESMGIPLPGEATLVTASIYAGTTHELNILLVILATIAGAVLGDNIGYWIGDKIGLRLLVRFGPRIGVTERKIKVGQYLFRLHGGKVVFFGRFVAILRVLAAFLAGTNRMHYATFFMANLSGAVVWASTFGLAAYAFGAAIHRFAGPAAMVIFAIAAAVLVLSFVLLRRREAELEEEAARAFPGPIRA